MKDLLLYLKDDRVKACVMETSSQIVSLRRKRYLLEVEYMGEWITYESDEGRVKGFLIVPMNVTNDYLESRILNTDFVREATNVRVKREGNAIYLELFLAPVEEISQEGPQDLRFINIYHNQEDDLIFCFCGFSEEAGDNIGFSLETEQIPVGIEEEKI